VKKRRRRVVRVIKKRKNPRAYSAPPIINYPLIEEPTPRDDTKIRNNIFYHMFCINDAVSRFTRTYSKIVLSGLIDIIDNIYVNCISLFVIDKYILIRSR
jgi:hypothetical protein